MRVEHHNQVAIWSTCTEKKADVACIFPHWRHGPWLCSCTCTSTTIILHNRTCLRHCTGSWFFYPKKITNNQKVCYYFARKNITFTPTRWRSWQARFVLFCLSGQRWPQHDSCCACHAHTIYSMQDYHTSIAHPLFNQMGIYWLSIVF